MEAQELRRIAMGLADGDFLPMPGHNLTWLQTVPSGRGRMRWDVFGCLYPKAPRYRLYSRDPLSTFERDAVEQEIGGAKLPRQLVSLAGRPDAAQRLKRCADFSARYHVPMGMYLAGRFFPGDGPRGYAVGALWSFDDLDAVWTLALLKRAIKETR